MTSESAGAMFDHLSLGSLLTSMAKNPRRTDLISRSTAQDIFMSSPIVEPETLAAFDVGQYAVLQSKLPNGVPSTPTWQWFKVLAGHLSYDKASPDFSPRASAELGVLGSISAGNDAKVLAAARVLRSVAAEPTELSLQAEVRAELALNGLESALTKCVDTLLEQPKLASWVPLGMLAREIAAGQVRPENIDIPIILDFAAKVGEAEFASARTYATEDFLSARGAIHPADLVASIAPDRATARERYLAAEVCTPANLKTSTMFGSERELESDRIAVCQWLTALIRDDVVLGEDQSLAAAGV